MAASVTMLARARLIRPRARAAVTDPSSRLLLLGRPQWHASLRHMSDMRVAVNRLPRQAGARTVLRQARQQPDDHPQAEQHSGWQVARQGAARLLSMAAFILAAALGPGAAALAKSSGAMGAGSSSSTTMVLRREEAASSKSSRQGEASDRQERGAYTATGIDLADSAAALLEAEQSSGSAAPAAAARPARSSKRQQQSSKERARAVLQARAEEYAAAHPELSAADVVRAQLAGLRGVPLELDAVLRSSVPDPRSIPARHSRQEVVELVDAIVNQYNVDETDLIVKQMEVEARIKAKMGSKGSSAYGGRGMDEVLGDELLAGDKAEANKLDSAGKAEDDYPFTTEVAEEFIAAYGEASGLRSAWRVQAGLSELSYSQLWALVGEGHVLQARFYGPEGRTALVGLAASAPGGARLAKVVLPPDPQLLDHMGAHGVHVVAGPSGSALGAVLPSSGGGAVRLSESDRLRAAFLAQLLRYAFPFMAISAAFWLLHTWLLDPAPNQFRRKEFIRGRREALEVAAKLNFRSPARQVRVNTAAADFIPWDEIHGIDSVKGEIEEIIEYLKDPGLLRLRGVARIGGVLLAGAPGTGKTMMAKAIAAESGVRMFTCSGTDFYDVYAGVGSRRIRETFDKCRQYAPAILFIDEFDALGASRSGSGGDEAASIINELLVQMDGFEDNRGVVVLGATNRPGAIDSALVRPGRFDRIIYMPLPNVEGRARILQVHARDKPVDPSINWREVARALSGFTGADCMGLMQRASRMAARQGRTVIGEEDIYAAMENKALEAWAETSGQPIAGREQGVPDPIPLSLRKSIAAYEAGKALIAAITPGYDEIARVSVCPYDLLMGYTLFIEDEERTAGTVLTRSEMEAAMVVHLAGRCCEKLLLGEAEVTGTGAPDVFHANMIAREMVMAAGMSARVGPVSLMQLAPPKDDRGYLLNAAPREGQGASEVKYHVSDMSSETARVALAEVIELLEAAEAKAYWGLAVNWKALQALTEALLERGVLQGSTVRDILQAAGVTRFPDPTISGFGWDPTGNITYPVKQPGSGAAAGAAAAVAAPEVELKGVARKTRFADTPMDAPRGPDGKYRNGWHWNLPYSVRQVRPAWYQEEQRRWSGSTAPQPGSSAGSS